MHLENLVNLVHLDPPELLVTLELLVYRLNLENLVRH